MSSSVSAAVTHSGSTPEARARVPRAGLVLAVLALAAFMASLDLFIVNVAFDEIGHDFRGASMAALSWVLNSYAIAYAALLVPLGRLADRFGRRQGFVLGLAVFTLASAACAASTALWALVAFRAIKAAGAALLTPASLGLVLDTTPPRDRARAVRVWAVTGSLAAAAGPVLGGALLAAGSWRWVFLVNVPVGALAIAGTLALVPASRPSAGERIPDLLGAAAFAGAVGALAYALVAAPDTGWTSARVLVAFASAGALAALFAWRTRVHPAPVVEPALLGVRSFAWSNAAALLFNLAFAANLLALVLWLQRVWRFESFASGVAIAPGPLMVPVFAAVAQRASRRGARAGRLAAAGCVLCGVAAVMLITGLGAERAYALRMLPAWLVGGAGVGLAMPTILSAATVDLPPARAATGSAVVNMSRQVGAVLGVSVLVAVMGAPHGFTETAHAFQRVWWVVAATSLLAAATALGMRPVAERAQG